MKLESIKKMAARAKDGEQGAIMVIALVALALGGLMIPPTLSHVGTGAKAVSVYENKTAPTQRV